MPVTCQKCGYERVASDTAPDYECPQCGAVYAKVEAHLKREEAEKQRQAIAAKEAEQAKQGRTVKEAEAEKLRLLRGKSICTECGYIGKPVRLTRGSILIEIVLWLAFLIPGLIYSIWRQTNKYQACQQCRHESIIPADSPKGRRLIAELSE